MKQAMKKTIHATVPLLTVACCALLTLFGCVSTAAPHGIPNFSQVRPGVWRGGQPTGSGWEYLKSLGVKWDVKLNTENEASDDGAKAHGIQVIYLPITLMQQTVGKPDATTLNVAVSAIERDGTFVHCQHGQDRTGLLVGAYRVKVEHWTKSAAYQEMKAHGFHPMLRGLYRSWQEDVDERADRVSPSRDTREDHSPRQMKTTLTE